MLPNVLRSDTNEAVFENVFNKFLTKDDTSHIAGYIGQSNPTSLTKRQLPEPTPQLQAFQLQPTLYTKVGSSEYVLPFKSFQKQSELMGIDFTRMQEWGNALQFNWVPPVNFDMLVNYADYFWFSGDLLDRPQYLTIESRCNKQQGILAAYNKLVAAFGDLFPIIEINVAENSVTISGQYTTLFIEGFRVWIKGTSDINIRNQFFTVLTSTYNLSTQTTLVVGVNAPAQEWTITGNFLSVLTPGAVFNITGNTGGADGTYTVAAATFDGMNTIIMVNETIPLSATPTGTCTIPLNVCAGETLPPQTTIFFDPDVSPIAIRSPTAPPASVVGRYWVDTDDNSVYCWSGLAWIPCSPIASGTLSLQELHSILRRDTNCVCYGDYGWDLALWDDSPPGWEAFLTPLSQPTQAAWITMNGTPVPLDLWLDTTNDILFQLAPAVYTITDVVPGSSLWVVGGDQTAAFTAGTNFAVVGNTGIGTAGFTVVSSVYVPVDLETQITVSEVIPGTATNDGSAYVWIPIIIDWTVFVGDMLVGDVLWDLATSCFNALQEPNQWTQQNKWVHKSHLTSFAGVRRAQIPIIEYDSRAELNSWTKINHVWKYRPVSSGSFETVSAPPQRFELEPIRGWLAVEDPPASSTWYLYLFDENMTQARDYDYTQEFVPDFRFLVRDNAFLNQLLTVDYSVHREALPTDPSAVQGYMITVVKLQDTGPAIDAFFALNPSGGTATNKRLEPQATSRGDTWRGYHVHWVLSQADETTQAAASQTENPVLARAVNEGDPWAFATQTSVGPTIVGDYFQEITPTTAVSTIQLDASFRFAPITEFVVVGVIPGPGGIWTISGNYASLFSINQSFVIPNNTGGGDGIYTVASVANAGPNTAITVNETIPPLADASGTIETGRLLFALAGQDQLRVFVDNIQQYGTYTEQTATGSPDYTAIGTTTTTLASFTYVTGIVFDAPLAQYAVVRIEVGSASLRDMGLQYVPVRTIENEATFLVAALAGTQPVYLGMNVYGETNQTKRVLNQYPLFNVYDTCTSEVIKASPLFAFKEDPTQPINGAVQRRIIVEDGGREYTFEQFLLEQDDGVIYSYRLFDGRVQLNDYWFNTANNTLKKWNGRTWQEVVVLQDTNDRLTVHRPFVGTTPPTYLVSVVGSVWYDTSAKVVRESNGVAWADVAWPEYDNPFSSTTPVGLFIEGTDPTLTTIWRSVPQYTHNTSGPPSTWTGGVYIPEWVDGDRNVLPVGDPNGDWEIPDQWRLNAEHHNKAVVKYSEIVTHFRSVLAAQPNVFGFLGGGANVRTQAEYDYSLGGIMKEHNDSYDTLLSAVNEIALTPLTVIEFAEDQYANLLLTIKELYQKNLLSYLAITSTASIIDQASFITTSVIGVYEGNDFYGQVYVDTSAFDGVNGIRHWISTIPMFGFGFKTIPYVNIDADLGIYELVHHDGHRSHIEFTVGEEDSYARLLVNLPDPRVFNDTLGKLSSSAPPATMTAFLTAFGVERGGVYWYRTSGPRALYRFNIIGATPTAPSLIGLPDGVYYWDTALTQLFITSGGLWVAVGLPGVISPAWQQVDMRELLTDVLLEVENRLYAVTPVYDELVFDFDSLTPTVSEQAYFDEYTEEQFMAFVNERHIRAPFENVGYTPTNAFTWNYINSTITTPPTGAISPDRAASWQELYTRWYGTPYPHLEPWKLQGYTDKPSWWDAEYLDLSGTRRWIYNHSTTTGMWENIRVGLVPLPYDLPDGTPSTAVPGEVRTYNYFSVNIADTTIAGNFNPDDLLPPYYSTVSIVVRSLFTSLAAEIVAPGANYVYGDGGPVEWLWTVSGEHVYDPLVIAFRMQPVRFLHYTFGPQFTRVNNLQVETALCQIYSHEDVLFHGDLYTGDQSYLVRGLNQWYVNYNRYVGYDTNKEFRVLWAEWDPLLAYQFSGIIDTSTFEITNKYYDVVAQDYNIVLANIGVIKDMWMDAFEVTVLNIPPAIVQYNNESSWRLELDNLASIPRTISYYDVKRYPFVVDVQTNTATIFQYNILTALPIAKLFEVEGDHVTQFTDGTQFDIINSSSNDGTYTVSGSAVYDPSTNRTRITVEETIPSTNTDGIIDFPNSILPWATGQLVFVTSSRILPAPLVQNQPVYLVVVNGRQFRVSDTPVGASILSPILAVATGPMGAFSIAGNQTAYFPSSTAFGVVGSTGNDGNYTVSTTLFDGTNTVIMVAQSVPNATVDGSIQNASFKWTTTGSGDLNVGEVDSSFTVFGSASLSNELWYHFALDNTKVRTFTPPYTIAGIQRMIDIIDGYQAYEKDLGVLYNLGLAGEVDPETGRAVSWQLEIERFIDWAFRLRRSRLSLSDRFGFVVNSLPNDELIFTGQIPQWTLGTQLLVSTTGTLPDPLQANVPYFYVPTATPGIFQLSTSRLISPTTIVDLVGNGSGTLLIAPYKRATSFPSMELNPARNNIWIDTPQGVLANVIQGPYADIRVQQTIFDQYSRPLTPDKLLVYRQDKQNRVSIRAAIPNDVVPPAISLADPYNYIHMGGAHFFLEGYEHIVLFNDYTVGNQIIYDQFFGLQTQRFGVDYYEKNDYTLRPTLGGYYLLSNKFYRNIEGQTTDMRKYYDTYDLNENTEVARRSRSLLGYRAGQSSFLDLLNTNSKTQFVFYRGMIQAKGSINSVKAYVNSRRFVDAKIDEFWAWKLADFGDSRPKIYPEIKLLATDGLLDDVRLEFLTDSEATDTEAVEADEANGFQVVTFSDEDRWVDAPEQRDLLENSILFLDSEVSTLTKVYASSVMPLTAQTTVDYWYNKTTEQLLVWNGTSWAIAVNPSITITEVSGDFYIKVPTFCDTVRVTRRVLTSSGDLRYYTPEFLTVENIPRSPINPDDDLLMQPSLLTEPLGNDEVERTNSEIIRMSGTGLEGILYIFTINPAKSKNSPAKIIDYQSEVVLSDVPFWHPARGHHSPIAIHNVDLQHATDPALYTNTLNPNDLSEQPWNQAEQNTVWLETNSLGYVPYYDDILFPNINDRLVSWGRLADWSEVRVYQWVETDLTPEEYTVAAADQVGDDTIASNTKTTGTPKLMSFRRERTPLSATPTVGTQDLVVANTFDVGNQVLLTTSGSLVISQAGVFVNTELFGALQSSMTAIISLTNVAGTLDEPSTATATIYDTPTVQPNTATGLVAGTYGFKVNLNGAGAIEYAVIIPGPTTTIEELATLMNTALLGVGTVEAQNNAIIITSLPLELPTTLTTVLATGTKYFVVFGTTTSALRLSDTATGTSFTYTTAGIGNLQVVPVFVAEDWVRKPVVSQKILPTIEGYPLSNPTFTLDGALFAENDVVNVYVNGTLADEGLIIDSSLQIVTELGLTVADIVVVARPVPVLTPEQLAFDPDTEDDGTINVQYKESTEFTVRAITIDGTDRTLYYFWVENRLNREIGVQNNLAPILVGQQLTSIPTPYLVVQRPQDDPYLAERFGYGIIYDSSYSVPWIYDQFPAVPVFYRQAILRRAADYITTDDRYEVRFTRDFTLRDTLEDRVNLKDTHQEWLLIRRSQGSNIDRTLWDRLTEALIGYKLTDPSILVPSLERTLYDEVAGTDTQYGLDEKQAMTSGTLSLDTVLTYLEDPNNDFYPIDINSFFATYSFDTPANIATAMDAIYNTFNSLHVNNIWFNCLEDGFSVKSKYKEFFKTSWVALHGIRVLEIAGIFDD